MKNEDLIRRLLSEFNKLQPVYEDWTIVNRMAFEKLKSTVEDLKRQVAERKK